MINRLSLRLTEQTVGAWLAYIVFFCVCLTCAIAYAYDQDDCDFLHYLLVEDEAAMIQARQDAEAAMEDCTDQSTQVAYLVDKGYGVDEQLNFNQDHNFGHTDYNMEDWDTCYTFWNAAITHAINAKNHFDDAKAHADACLCGNHP